MTIREAKELYRRLAPEEETLSEEDFFLYTEVLGFLIEKTHDPKYMVELGGAYYAKRDFDLALTYYEMAADLGSASAIMGLGYIWYYGRTGQVDYEKAFRYYSSLPDHLVARYKVADMYKNGYYVQKDYDKYKAIIESLYPLVRDLEDPFAPVPEVLTRLAGIRTEEGRTEEAVSLYVRAKEVLAERIGESPFFGNLTIMKYLIQNLYALTAPDRTKIDLFDLYEVLRTPVKVTFVYDEEEKHTVEAVEENGEIVIRFDEIWYRTVDDFFAEAMIDGQRLVVIEWLLSDFEVMT